MSFFDNILHKVWYTFYSFQTSKQRKNVIFKTFSSINLKYTLNLSMQMKDKAHKLQKLDISL